MIKKLIKKLNIKAGLLHFVRNDSRCKKVAFTLAEVLITLGIIGVVAALTIPVIHGTILKHRVETGLKKFNSTMNNALLLYVSENGDLDIDLSAPNFEPSYENNLKILNQYFLPYIKYSQIKECDNLSGYACVYLQDGALFTFNCTKYGGDIVYFVYPDMQKSVSGKTHFAFQLGKRDNYNFENTKVLSRNSIEPYVMDWDGTENGTKGLRTHSSYGCNSNSPTKGFCTKLIQQNGWKIPKDYPIKF